MSTELCTRTFVGRAGLRSVPNGWKASSPDPDAFRAQVSERRLAGILFFSLVGNAHEARRSADAMFPEHGVTLLHTITGSAHYDREGQLVSVHAGEIGVMRNDGALTYRIDSPTRTISAIIPEAEFPANLLDSIGPLLPHTLPPTAATRPLTDLMQEVMFGEGELSDHARRYLGRAVVDLAVGLVVANRHELSGTGATTETTDVRVRIAQYIDAHLTEADLGPKSIADALGFSVRYLHQVFSAPGVSIARYIRHSRLDRVVAALRDDSTPPSPGALALRFGFSSSDHLARAFRERFGTSIRDFVAEMRHSDYVGPSE